MTASRAPRPATSTRVRVEATQDGLGRVFQAYDRFARAQALPDNVRRDLYVALEEIVSNVVRHGGATPVPHISVTMALERDGVRVDIVDNGPAFDPFSAAAPDVTQPLLERPIGGLGVLFVSRLTDEHTYARRDNRNCVKLWRRIKRRKSSTRRNSSS